MCNPIIRMDYFPDQLNVAQIIMILKSNKPLEEASSYRPISLFQIRSKIFEKSTLNRLRPILEKTNPAESSV
jgi:hypothetical protein